MRVLIADNDPGSRSALVLELSLCGYEVVAVGDGQAAWEILQAPEAPSLVILDGALPGMDAVRVVEAVRRRASEPYPYVLVLSSPEQPRLLVEAMEAGADDFLTKPVETSELEFRLRAGRRILELQADLLAAHEALRVQSTHDRLTGLWNRPAILDVLSRELARAGRERRSVAILVADIDHLEEINDTLGHPVGDEVLRQVAERIEGSIRCYDLAGRFGGEEFLIVVPDCPSGRMAAGVAERICEAVRGRPFVIGPVRLSVTVSVGATTELVARPEGVDGVLERVDRALRSAKDGGRDRACFVAAPSRGRALPDSVALPG